MIHIEKYRGFDIHFRPDTDSFTFELDDSYFEKKSFSSCKLKIDEFIKDNLEFQPVVAVSISSYSGFGTKYNVIGIRKDGRFVIDKKGKKEQLSAYDEKNYIIYTPDLDPVFAKLAVLQLEQDKANKAVNEFIKIITGTPLSSLKERYLK